MNTRKIFLAVTLLLSIFVISKLGFAQMNMQHQSEGHKSGMKKGETVTITGHVIEPFCYMTMDMIGEKHKICSQICAEKGMNPGILEEKTNTIYLALPEGHGNPNEKLMAFMEEDVKVTGKIWEKGGLKAIQINKVEKAK